MRLFLVLLSLLAISPALAQWQVPLGSVPIGRGAGVTGFSSVVTTGTGNAVLSAGPTFTGTITAALANFSGAVNFNDTTNATTPSSSASVKIAGGMTVAKDIWIADGHFISVGSATPAASTLNFITVNSPSSGSNGGAGIQQDIDGALAWTMGNASGVYGGAFDNTTVFASQHGWKWLTGAGGGATPLFTAGTIRIASDGTISSSSNATQLANLGVGMFIATFSGVNFNSANTDNQFNISLPTGFTRYQILRLQISHASGTLTTSTFGVFSAAGGAGTAVVASGTANTVSTASENTANNTMTTTVAVGASGGTTSINFASLFFRVQTAQGSAATADVTILYHAMP